MNQVLIDFPEKLQANAFGIWMENKGFELFQAYYGQKMPEERQPQNSYTEFDNSNGRIKHIITIE